MTMSVEGSKANPKYVLVTAAYNEARYIEKVLQSVVAQTHRPVKWIIVSDGSTDGTDEIVSRYAGQHAFIRLLRVEMEHERDFAAKVHALQRGWSELQLLGYQFIGILDADISLGSDYFYRLLRQFGNKPKLGLAGGFIQEVQDDIFRPRSTNRTTSVPGGIQFYRRECWEAIGGIYPLRYGGEDWCAEVHARMLGWEVRSFPEIKAYHHRATGTAGSLLLYRFRQGRMDYSLGSDTIFEVLKCLRRISETPVLMGTGARLIGYAWSCFRHENTLPKDIREFLRREQRQRIKSWFYKLTVTTKSPFTAENVEMYDRSNHR